MKIFGEEKEKPRVEITIKNKEGKITKEGKKSISFTVEETTMEELEKVIKDAIRKSN